MKDCPTVAVAVAALVITGILGLTVKVSDWFPVPPRLLAEIVMVMALAVVGVPEMKPVEEFTVRPAGSPVALKLVGVLFAVMV